MLYFYTWKIASTSPIHPQIKLQDVPCLSLSKVIIIMYGLYKKEIKDAYPKKICHMPTRHVKKKEKRCIPKEGMPHTHKVCQKEREKKKI